MSFRTRWTTEDEIAYIRNIGMWKVYAPVLDRNATDEEQAQRTEQKVKIRHSALKRYLETSKLRADWCSMSKPTIMGYVNSELAKLEKLNKDIL